MPPKPISRLLYRNLNTRGTRQTLRNVSTDMVQRVKRVSRKGVTTQSVNTPAQPGVKMKQAWKYPNRQIQRMASVVAPSGAKLYDHIDTGEARRKQESNLFITVNTNKGYNDDTPEQNNAVEEALRRTLAQMNNDATFAVLLKFGPVHPLNYGDDKYTDVIESVEWQARVEVGEKYHRIHAHIWMTIHHYSQVQLNVHMMMVMVKQLYNRNLEALGFSGTSPTTKELRMTRQPYVHVKPLPQSNFNDIVKQYIHKAMQSSA